MSWVRVYNYTTIEDAHAYILYNIYYIYFLGTQIPATGGWWVTRSAYRKLRNTPVCCSRVRSAGKGTNVTKSLHPKRMYDLNKRVCIYIQTTICVHRHVVDIRWQFVFIFFSACLSHKSCWKHQCAWSYRWELYAIYT